MDSMIAAVEAILQSSLYQNDATEYRVLDALDSHFFPSDILEPLVKCSHHRLLWPTS